MSAPKRLWLLNRGRIGKILLGPSVRSIEMARAAVSRGFEVHLCMDGCEGSLPAGVQFHALSADSIRAIAPGDRILTTIFLDVRCLRALLDSSHSFDVDFYCVGALENLATESGLSSVRLFQGRRRTARRYRWLLESANRILVSNPEQIAFLGGTLFADGHGNACATATSLPSRSLVVPMGVSGHPFPTGSPNPYPKEIQERRIYLWGGGIWAWFDVATLLKAFALLKNRGSDACLFFLTGSNPSGLSSQNAPAEKAIELARELEILGTHVYFLEGGVSPRALHSYLEHCWAGAMSNPGSLESLGSWRTRYLDLLWAGKPLVCSGKDPLGALMERHGLAHCVPAGDVAALADALEAPLPTEDASALRNALCWDSLLTEWLDSLESPRCPRILRISPREWVAYALGL